MNPWYQMSNEATRVKAQIGEDLLSLNEDNIAPFSTNAELLLKTPFEQGGIAAEAFQMTTSMQIDAIQMQVNTASSQLLANLSSPWTGAEAPVNTFSDTVNTKLTWAVGKAQTDAITMTTSLTEPWKQGTTAVNTWSNEVARVLDKTVQDYKEKADEISRYKDVINNTPSYTTDQNPPATSSGNSGGTKYDSPIGPGASPANVKALQEILNEIFNANIKVDGSYGSATKNAVKKAQKQMNESRLVSVSAYGDIPVDGQYGQKTAELMGIYLTDSIKYMKSLSGSSTNGQMVQVYQKAKNKLPAAFHYAKGTLGTKRDEWAVTDESWIGEEITLAAGKNGQLQYLKKGSAVMPADISANLVEWGKINPDMTALANGIQGVNLMSNYVSKPEVNVSFDSLVHVDNCSQDTLKDLEKMVDTKINQFSKQMNYAIKRYK
jgi:peptidoglycan hydrolase-like protein with peptidoglycan-binding domain